MAIEKNWYSRKTCLSDYILYWFFFLKLVHKLNDDILDAHYENLLQDVVDANMNMLDVCYLGVSNKSLFDLVQALDPELIKRFISPWEPSMYHEDRVYKS